MEDLDRRLRVLLDQGRGRQRPLPPKTWFGRLRPLALIVSIVVVIAASFLVWFMPRGEQPLAVDDSRIGAQSQNPGWWGHPSLGTEEAGSVVIPIEKLPATATPPPSARPVSDGLFRVDERGQLQLDEHMRLGVESLLALNDPTALESALDAHLTDLPPQAAAAARRLVRQYADYADAIKRGLTSDTAPLVPEEGLAELDRLSALRTTYFGREAAQRMFGDEEAITRRLLELMRDDPIPHASMAEKAIRAQARFDKERAGQIAPSDR
jgi:hypothetical protein